MPSCVSLVAAKIHVCSDIINAATNKELTLYHNHMKLCLSIKELVVDLSALEMNVDAWSL